MKPLTILDGPDQEGKLAFMMDWESHSDFNAAFGRTVDPTALLPTLLSRSEARIDGYWDQFDPLVRRVLDRLALSKSAVRVVFQKGYHLDHNAGTLPALYVESYQVGDFKKVQRLIESRRLPINTGPGVGAFKDGCILLVGDRPNLRSGETYLGPFCSWRKNGCSAWLSSQLEKADITEDQLYWVNAYEPSGKVTSARFLSDLKPRTVVALGRHADVWCREVARLDGNVTVQHPQFHKRFHAHQPYPLIDLLRSLIYGPITRYA